MVLNIQQANLGDAETIARLHVEGWQGAYGGLIDQGYIDSQTVQLRTEKWQEIFTQGESTTLLATFEDKPVGFVSYGPLRTAPPGTSKIRPLYTSEIYAIYLAPDFFRKGIGTQLMSAATHDLKTKKHQSTCLWVLEGNKRARGFYDKMGGQRIGKKMVEFGPTKAKEICYGWRDFDVFKSC